MNKTKRPTEKERIYALERTVKKMEKTIDDLSRVMVSMQTRIQDVREELRWYDYI